MSSILTISPIATVANDVHVGLDTGWGAVVSCLELAPRYHGMLDGLDAFSHVLVVFWMHENGAAGRWTTAESLAPRRHPRDREDLPEVGLLAQRAKHRPNPIGVTVCERLSVESGRLIVRGLDALHGTPVLDIKPHVPAFDARPDATTAPWLDTIMRGYFTDAG